jgi:type I restriction enzyme S subunit
MSEFDFFETTIGEQITLQRGFDITKKEQIDGEVPVVSSGGISSFHNQPKVNSPGVVLGRKGTLGSVYYLNKPFWPHDTTLWIKDFKGNDPRFVYYFFLSISELLKSMDVGAANPALNRNHVHPMTVLWPSIAIQQAIAHILGTLDEKIELNRKMNQTLESMAQALFKSWFVDFDPVIDNALAQGNEIPEELQARAEKCRHVIAREERPKQSPDEGGMKQSQTLKPLLHTNPSLAAQFPSSFVFNERLGKWIPEGWEEKRIEDIATVVGGGTPSTKVDEYFTDKGIPWLSPKDLSGYEWKFIRKGATDITELGLKNSGAKLMPAGSVLFSSRAPIGYMAIAENEICTNQGFKSLVPEKGVPTEYLYQLLKSNMDKIEAVATGSTFKEVSGSALKGIEVLVPSSKLLVEFSEKSKPSSERQLTIQKETETLTQLRDRLLPELISGRVRVGNFNKNET